MVTRSIPSIAAIAALLLQSACSWQSPQADGAASAPAEVAAVNRDARTTASDERDVPAQPTGAAAQLLDAARAYRAQGDHARAANSIERALRIERGNPWLYLELARVRAGQGQPQQAAALLGKARAVSGGAPAIVAAVAEAARDLQVTVPGL